MIIKNLKFDKSSSKLEQCPKGTQPEFAFIGRSNVGKSSLINLITGHKKLAKISVSPGKTKLINHFLINESWYLVDLPGYGYARASKTEKRLFSKLIEDYILKREQLVCLFILLDIRIEPQDIDLNFIAWIGKSQIPFVLVFTKTDKINQKTISENTKKFERSLLQTWETLPPFYFTSTIKKQGKDEILKFIESLLKISNT